MSLHVHGCVCSLGSVTGPRVPAWVLPLLRFPEGSRCNVPQSSACHLLDDEDRSRGSWWREREEEHLHVLTCRARGTSTGRGQEEAARHAKPARASHSVLCLEASVRCWCDNPVPTALYPQPRTKLLLDSSVHE